MSADSIADIPVSFHVTNVNKTVACIADGKNYTVRGHLTGPASKIHNPDAVTLVGGPDHLVVHRRAAG
ncbi:MAG: hypothetical protein JO100_05485 [Pseudonocardia sp.]|nr:hypothetical protein [Pseudonocardia sp.]